MSELMARFIREYDRALREHLATNGEEELAAAYDLGRWALANGLGLLDVVETHQSVIDRLGDTGAAVGMANQFLLQGLAAFEMAQRGFWEAQERIKVEEELVERLQAVTTGSVAIMGRVTSQERLGEFVQQARAVVGAAHAALELYGDDPQSYTTAPEPIDDALRGLARAVAASGRPVRIDPRGPADHPVVCVPALADRGDVRGALLAWGNRQFDASDEAALRQLATVGTTAWNNALVYERQHEIALTLQQSLLPEAIPDIPALRIAVRYVPAGPSSQVGGDWYDVIELPGGQIGFVVGDVMGHDIKAASVMGQLRLALRAYAVDGYGAAEVINRVDRLLGQLDSSQYATAVYAVLDPGSGRMGIVNAGHPAPLLLDRSGRADFVTAGESVALGLGLPSLVHHEEPLILQRGSTLLLYSDGLIESRRRTLDEGMARLRSSAADFEGSPEELCDLVLTRVRDTTLQDDICLLAVRLD